MVDRAAFFGGDWPQGFHELAPQDAAAFLGDAQARGRFVDRPLAERTPAWKQWIPYCVIRLRGAPVRESGIAPDETSAPLTAIFTVQRTAGQGEARLHGAFSIGLGGHVDPEDAGTAHAAVGTGFFARALARELTEELDCAPTDVPPRFVGILNDDRTSVGTVHAGLVYVWDLIANRTPPRELVQVREISKMRGGFGSLVEFHELWQDPAKFESWSQILIRAGVAGRSARA